MPSIWQRLLGAQPDLPEPPVPRPGDSEVEVFQAENPGGDLLRFRRGAGVEQFRNANQGSLKDYTPYDQDRAIWLSHCFYRRDSSYKRDINLLADFVWGSGIEWTHPIEECAEIVDKFWGEGGNDIPGEGWEQIASLLKYGEQLYPASTGPLGGVDLGAIDPYAIERVVNHGRNTKAPDKIVLKRRGNAFVNMLSRVLPDSLVDKEVLQVIRRDPMGLPSENMPNTTPFTLGAGAPLNGEAFGELGVFYFHIQREQTATRGYPFLADGFDWYSLQNEALYRFGQRAKALASVIWQCHILGVTDDKFNEVADEIEQKGAPIGEVIRCVNEGMKWEAITPDLGSAEHGELVRLLGSKTGDSSGLPPHLRGIGLETSMATAREMGHGPFRQFERLQGIAVRMFDLQVKLALWWAKSYRGRLQNVKEEDVLKPLQFHVDPIRDRDRKAELEQLQMATEAIDAALRLDAWPLTPEEAVTVWRNAAIAIDWSVAEETPEELIVQAQKLLEEGPVSRDAAVGLFDRTRGALQRLTAVEKRPLEEDEGGPEEDAA